MEENINTIQKPVSVAREELIAKLVECINISELPIYVIESVIDNLSREVHQAAQQQYINEKTQYELALSQLGTETEKVDE